MGISRPLTGLAIAVLAVAVILIVGLVAVTEGRAETTMIDELGRHVGPYAG
ncbi:MAG TPA: hypothetical protein VGB52_00165 [Actinomycetota bacterium]